MNDAPQKRQRPGSWLIDIVSLVVVIYLGFVSIQLAQHLDAANILLLAFFAYVIMRLGYELVFRRMQVPTYATGFVERRKIVELIRADAAGCESYHVIDLGSGRGELTRSIARALPQAQVTGVEMSPLPYAISVLLARLFRLKNTHYRRGDLFAVDCSSMDAVVMYLSDELTQKAGIKLRHELKPGALIIANDFPLQTDWLPEDILRFHTPFEAVVYFYRQK
jgi:SAM-dependent methyltransferase